jgi:hypothetical protein
MSEAEVNELKSTLYKKEILDHLRNQVRYLRIELARTEDLLENLIVKFSQLQEAENV